LTPNSKPKLKAINHRKNNLMKSSLTNTISSACSHPARRLLACTLAGLALITSAFAQPRFTVTDLGTMPGGDFSTANGLNDRGDVVGHWGAPNSDNTGFVWRNGVMTSTGRLPKGIYSYANAINSVGVIVGDGDTGNHRPQSWVTGPNGLINFFPNNCGNTHSVGINDSGAICGYYTKSLSGQTASWRGAIWTVDPKDPRKYRMMDLPILAGIDPASATALPFAFNQAGQAAGYAVNDVIGQHACFWNNNAAHSLVDLGVFPGDWSSLAYGMNNLGQVAGESHPPFGSRPVVWNNDAAHTPYELSVLPGDNSGSATAISNLGHVLGVSYYSTPGTWDATPPRLVVWRDGGVFELQSVLDADTGAGWTLTSATAINNLGQIVGGGMHNGQARAFLLTPVAQ
jgi:uncharacterized membrane protein